MTTGLTKQEEEILILRERERLTFQEIGILQGISQAGASRIYKSAWKRRQKERRYEQEQLQNQISVPLSLTLGELAVLERILLLYSIWEIEEGRRWSNGRCKSTVATDYAIALHLRFQFSAMGQEIRSSLEDSRLCALEKDSDDK